jgi:hypothetical protein
MFSPGDSGQNGLATRTWSEGAQGSACIGVAAVAIGYMISRGLAKSGSKYSAGEDPLNRNND